MPDFDRLLIAPRPQEPLQALDAEDDLRTPRR
jgi:hypothetical protein